MSDKLAFVSAAALLCSAAISQSSPPPIPLELRSRFGFTGPIAVKIGDGLADLQVHDLNGDGRAEAVVFDGRRARLVAVRLDGTEATMRSIPTDGQIAGYTVADVDGDGKPDLLLVDGRGRLTIRDDQGKERLPSFDLGLGGRGLTLLTGDLDGDGKQDLIALARGQMRVVRRFGSDPALSAIEPLDDNAYSVHLSDLDGDGRLDLSCIVPQPRMNLRLRLGRGDGSFGPWRIASIDGLRSAFPTTLADGKAALATIEGQNRRLAVHRLVHDAADAALEWWAFGDQSSTKTPAFAIGDVDHDGDDDLVLAPADRAQMLFYEWRDGSFVRHELPTLTGVASIAIGDVDGDGAPDLVFASPEEDVLAWKSGKEPLADFPTQLAVADKPLAATPAPGGGIYVVTRNDKRQGQLVLVSVGGEAKTVADLGRLQADPTRLVVADIGDADGHEISFVVPGEGLRVLTIGSDGKAGEQKNADKSSAGFTKKLDDSAFAVSSFEGKPALLAVRDRFVRCFRIDGQGQVQVLSQDNGPAGLAELSLAAECPTTNGVDWLWLDKKSDKLVRTSRSGPPRTVEVPGLGFTNLVAHRGAALLIGPRGLLRVPFSTGLSLTSVATHEPPTIRTFYREGRSGDFDHDGIQDILLVDGTLPGLQIVAGGRIVDGGSSLERALAIPVFEAPPSNEPDNEPRALATGDLDGDGRCDFVLIAHDRLLFYPQDK
jgi:hypothetical protein